MRCVLTQCENNADGFCSTPDYVAIDENGKCNQIWVKSHTVTAKYIELKTRADKVYKEFNDCPNHTTSEAYRVVLNEFTDFCVEVLTKIVDKHPEITNSIIWEEEF